MSGCTVDIGDAHRGTRGGGAVGCLNSEAVGTGRNLGGIGHGDRAGGRVDRKGTRAVASGDAEGQGLTGDRLIRAGFGIIHIHHRDAIGDRGEGEIQRLVLQQRIVVDRGIAAI